MENNKKISAIVQDNLDGIMQLYHMRISKYIIQLILSHCTSIDEGNGETWGVDHILRYPKAHSPETVLKAEKEFFRQRQKIFWLIQDNINDLLINGGWRLEA